MKLLFCTIILVCYFLHFTKSSDDLKICNSVTPEDANIVDFYWRPYMGIIPQDAVPGGVDRMGMTTYIGEAIVHPYGTLVASIYQGNRTAVTSAYKTHYVDKNVKILCSKSPEKFQWIPTDIDKIQLITNCHLIVGDVDHGYEGNIGRVNFNGEIVLGKVIRLPQAHHGLFVPYNGKETRFTHYEVLGYDCKPININIELTV